MNGLSLVELTFLFFDCLALAQLCLHLLGHVAFRPQQRVGLHQLAILNAVGHLAVEIVQLVIVQLGVALGHVGDELLVAFLVLVEFLHGLAVLFVRELLLFFQGLYFVLALLQLLLQVAPYLPLSVQPVLQLLLGCLHHDVERVGGGLVGFSDGVHVDQLIAFLLH